MATTILDTFITVFEYKVQGIDKLDKVGKKMDKMGKDMTRKVTMPIVGAFGAMILAASKFEDGLDNVLNLLDTEDVDKYQGALGDLQKEAVKAGFALGDTNRALFDNVSALGVGEQAIDNFQVAQKLAIAGNAELGVAVDGQTSILNAYGKEVTDATEVAIAFFTAQKFGKTTVAALSGSVGKVAPIAKMAGIGYDTLLASMSQLTLGGLSTEEATTALRSAITGLVAPAGQAGDVLESMGLPIGAVALQAADFADVLMGLAEAAKENPDAMAEMFPNTRALTAISALGAKEVANLRDMVKQMGEQTAESSFMLDGYNRRAGNAANKTKQMWGQMQVAAKVLGENLLPIFLKITNVINKFFEALENMSPAMQKTVLVTMALLAAIGPLLLMGSKMIVTFNIIRTAVLALKAAQIGLNLAMFANPIGLVIAAVAALVGWFLLARSKTDSWKEALQLMGSQLIGFGQRLLKFMILPINQLVSQVIRLLSVLSKIPGAGKLKGLAESLKEMQGDANLKLTGSSSINPFASRESAVPFDPLNTQASVAPASSGGRAGAQDNRRYDITAEVNVNEAMNGAEVAEQFVAEIDNATRNAAQDFATNEA
jgi:TP901 family phage tail tape measure protein